MPFLRIFYTALAFLFFGIGALIISFVIFPVIKIFFKKPKKLCVKIIQNSWKILIKYLEWTKIIELEYPKEIFEIKNKIIVASHPTYIDIVILISLISNSLCLAKKELMQNFFMKNIVETLYILNDSNIDYFEKASKQALDEGYNIIIFPTGKRTESNENIHIHKGAAQISLKTGVAILPVKIVVSEQFLPKGKPFYTTGNNTVKIKLEINKEIVPSEIIATENTDISKRNAICNLIKERI